MSTPAFMRYAIDSTEFSTVAICKVPDCGARYSTGSRVRALRALAEHCAVAHTGLKNNPACVLKDMKNKELAKA